MQTGHPALQLCEVYPVAVGVHLLLGAWTWDGKEDTRGGQCLLSPRTDVLWMGTLSSSADHLVALSHPPQGVLKQQRGSLGHWAFSAWMGTGLATYMVLPF